MKQIAMQFLMPAYPAYRQYGAKAAAPIAVVWAAGVTAMVYGLSSLSEVGATMGLALWMVSQMWGTLANDHQASQQRSSEQRYHDDPLAAVKSVLRSDGVIETAYRRYDFRKSLAKRHDPACPIAH